MAVFFISDLHLGHKRILQFEDGKYRNWGCSTPEEHDQELIRRINSTLNKKDKLIIGGDVVFGKKNLWMLGEITGYKHIILGNHDTEYFNYKDYIPYVDKIGGIEKYKKHWITHAPIHPCELRGKNNIHGHVHHNSVQKGSGAWNWDRRYINICVEALDGYPIPFELIENGEYWNIKKV